MEVEWPLLTFGPVNLWVVIPALEFKQLMEEYKMSKEGIVTRLRKRAEIRRNIKTRKSVQEGAPDRIADLLEEAADVILQLKEELRIEREIANWRE